MAKKQIKAAGDGRALNDDADLRDDKRTDMMCGSCMRRFNSAREPYSPAICWQCWGINAPVYWQTWIQQEFFAAYKAKRRTACVMQTLRKIERVIGDPRINVQHIISAIEKSYMLGRERTYFIEWRGLMIREVTRIHNDVQKRAVVEVEPQQLKLTLFGR